MPSVERGKDNGQVPQRRALPGWAIDAITEGVPNRDTLSPKAARTEEWRLLVRTAMSAQAARWPRADWIALVLDRQLGQQLRFRVRTGRAEKEPNVIRRLCKGWEQGWQFRETGADWSVTQRAAEAERHAALARDAAANPDQPLDEAQRAALSWLADAMTQRGMTRITAPCRVVAEATGLSRKAAYAALMSLCRQGFLHVHSRGGAHRDGQPPRANIYELGARGLNTGGTTKSPGQGTTKSPAH